jgi:hypothetical protein
LAATAEGLFVAKAAVETIVTEGHGRPLHIFTVSWFGRHRGVRREEEHAGESANN